MSNAWVVTVMAERSLFQIKQRERAVENKLLIREREAVLDLRPIFVFTTQTNTLKGYKT